MGAYMGPCNVILVVEDDDSIREILCEVLEAEGFTVYSASNGQMALNKLAAIERPALIFLDIMMPIMDGKQFLSLIGSDVTLAAIPVVITSATHDTRLVNGARSFIKKPLDLEIVLETARKYCGG